jgi:hypothetical protein
MLRDLVITGKSKMVVRVVIWKLGNSSQSHYPEKTRWAEIGIAAGNAIHHSLKTVAS